MIEVYDKYQSTVLGVQTVSPDDISKYGAVACRPVGDRVYKVSDLVEKPKRGGRTVEYRDFGPVYYFAENF